MNRNIVKVFNKSIWTLFFLLFGVFSTACVADNYVDTGLVIDKIKVYKQGWAIVTLTTEGSNTNGCTGTYNGKGSGFYFYVRSIESRFYDTIEMAYLNGTTIDIGFLDTCVSLPGMTMPEIYLIDI